MCFDEDFHQFLRTHLSLSLRRLNYEIQEFFLQDLSEFLLAFEHMSEGFRERARDDGLSGWLQLEGVP